MGFSHLTLWTAVSYLSQLDHSVSSITRTEFLRSIKSMTWIFVVNNKTCPWRIHLWARQTIPDINQLHFGMRSCSNPIFKFARFPLWPYVQGNYQTPISRSRDSKPSYKFQSPEKFRAAKMCVFLIRLTNITSRRCLTKVVIKSGSLLLVLFS